MSQYLPIFLMLVLGILFAAVSILASRLLAPRRPTAAKQAPYECGIVPSLEPAERFPVKFYLVAMIFIVFDIEIIFLYPWAVAFGDLGTFGLWEMGVFAVAVAVAFYFLLSEGALEWGPANRLRLAMASGRTLESTVRRIPAHPAPKAEAPGSEGTEVSG
jgi:NADH-quinone oxidoreductase subunit A